MISRINFFRPFLYSVFFNTLKIQSIKFLEIVRLHHIQPLRVSCVLTILCVGLMCFAGAASLAFVSSVSGQTILEHDVLEDEGVFAPLESVDLNFSDSLEVETLPALQPNFTAPPLENDSFPANLIQDQLAQEAVLRLDAHLSAQSLPLVRGLQWHVFRAETGLDNKLPLVESKQGGLAEFRLKPGEYLVHVAFGRAEVIKKLELEAGRTYYENIELAAGGVMLNVKVPGGSVNKNRVRFAIHKQDDETGSGRLIVEDIQPDRVVRLGQGLYHVISTYGDANAIASADVRVEAGKLTQAVIEHQAAQVALKLVRETGGEALADTSWVVMNASGDTVREVANPYLDIVLAEGDYIAYARNKEHSYMREFSVSPGEDMELDVLIGRDDIKVGAP